MSKYEEHDCIECELPCDCDMNDKTCITCSECQDREMDRNEDPYDTPYDRLSAAEQYEHDQREAFNDRYQAWRNEY